MLQIGGTEKCSVVITFHARTNIVFLSALRTISVILFSCYFSEFLELKKFSLGSVIGLIYSLAEKKSFLEN